MRCPPVQHAAADPPAGVTVTTTTTTNTTTVHHDDDDEDDQHLHHRLLAHDVNDPRRFLPRLAHHPPPRLPPSSSSSSSSSASLLPHTVPDRALITASSWPPPPPPPPTTTTISESWSHRVHPPYPAPAAVVTAGTISSLTKKRKAAEAIDALDASILASNKRVASAAVAVTTATAVPHAGSALSNSRAPIDASNSTSRRSSGSNKSTSFHPSAGPGRKSKSTARPPPSPQTTGMDSEEDDFMSGFSSEEDNVLQDETDGEDGSADDDFGFDEPEPDLGFSQKDILPKQKKSFAINFTVFHPQDIQHQQDEVIDEVNMILDIRKEDAAILLRHFRWNKERLIEDYMDRPKKVLEAAGLAAKSTSPPTLEVIAGFMCDICCEDEEGLQSLAMKCGHRYCVDCYRHYLHQKIREEGEAARIQCPNDSCNRIIDARSLDLLVTPDLQQRYQELLTRTYVEDKDYLKWCPAPDCANAIECAVKRRDLDKVVPTVTCDCKHRFCFGCILDDHQPAPCELVKKWLKKCADDSETANWISANTKECPKCNSTIEKNGGCNHMTCRKCKHEFCWMCMGLWAEHGTAWYNCNRYEEKSGTDARDAQTKSRVSLERYLHYYNRYANHEQSAKLDKDLYAKTEKKMISLQSASGMSWIEVQYLNAASQALQTCRQTLKWTYAFAFYLARNNLTVMFEDNQKDLEMAVEALSEMFEKPVQDLAQPKLKVEIMDKTAYCTKRRRILLDDTADNLANGEWDWTIDLLPPAAKGGRPSMGA